MPAIKIKIKQDGKTAVLEVELDIPPKTGTGKSALEAAILNKAACLLEKAADCLALPETWAQLQARIEATAATLAADTEVLKAVSSLTSNVDEPKPTNRPT